MKARSFARARFSGFDLTQIALNQIYVGRNFVAVLTAVALKILIAHAGKAGASIQMQDSSAMFCIDFFKLGRRLRLDRVMSRKT